MVLERSRLDRSVRCQDVQRVQLGPSVLGGEILHFTVITTTRMLAPAVLCPPGMFTFSDEKSEGRSADDRVRSIRGRFLLACCGNQCSPNVTVFVSKRPQRSPRPYMKLNPWLSLTLHQNHFSQQVSHKNATVIPNQFGPCRSIKIFKFVCSTSRSCLCL